MRILLLVQANHRTENGNDQRILNRFPSDGSDNNFLIHSKTDTIFRGNT